MRTDAVMVKAHKAEQSTRQYISCKRRNRQQWRPVEACGLKKCCHSCKEYQNFTR